VLKDDIRAMIEAGGDMAPTPWGKIGAGFVVLLLGSYASIRNQIKNRKQEVSKRDMLNRVLVDNIGEIRTLAKSSAGAAGLDQEIVKVIEKSQARHGVVADVTKIVEEQKRDPASPVE